MFLKAISRKGAKAQYEIKSSMSFEQLENCVAWVPDLIYARGRFQTQTALVCDATGRIVTLLDLDAWQRTSGAPAREGETQRIRLPELGLDLDARFIHLRRRAMLPALVNAHSHAFQRVIRGRTEHRTSRTRDSFWTWREMMYSAATRLTPEDIYDASRMAFMEMALSGITSVGEFHYLHRTPEGAEYDDANLLAKQVTRAARDVGLRIALLRVAYARAGFQAAPDERQRRFIEPEVETYLRRVDDLRSELEKDAERDGAPRGAWVGVAPHSVRAAPLAYLRSVHAYAAASQLPLHMHVAEQPAELEACLKETGHTPVALLDREGLLDANFTGVHAVHITREEAQALGRAQATVCACPTTERNLGDGIVPADMLFEAGAAIALGTDSHTQIDLLEDARGLEYHLRLRKLERNVLAPDDEASNLSALATRLFDCATRSGARSIASPTGELAPGRPADFFTVDLDDSSIAGAGTEDLLAAILFSLARTGIRDTVVGGRAVVCEGRHHAQDEITHRFVALQRKLWG